MIAGILVQLLRVFRVPRAWCAALVIPAIWFYTGATGWQPSAIRSSIMMTIVIGGWSLKRPTNLLNSLGAAGFVILLWEPQQLFQASFQLSFFVVLSLALLLPAFEKLRQRFTQHDPFLPPELLPRWHRFVDVPVRWLSMMFVTSLAAWIGSLPFVATYFHLFTPVTLLANVVIVPLSSFALMCNLGSLLCAPFLPPIAELFNHGAWFFMYVMVQATGWFANAPAAYFYVPAPTLAQSGLYFVVVFSLVTGVLFEKRWIRWLAPLCGILLCVSAWQWLSDYQSWKITILPVDGGDAVFVDAPGRKNDLMVDCGSDRSVEYVTKPFLRSQGVNRLETLVLTHGDVKHMGGATNVVREFGVRRVCVSPVKHRSSTYRTAMDWLAQQNELSVQVKQGDRLNRWTVLHPSAADKFPQADDGPVVLRGEINKTSLLLLSDLSRAGQHLLWERAGGLLRSDIVVSGLPREGEPLNEALLDAIAPKLIVVTDSEFPASERAPATLRQRLAKRGIQVIYCREAGAVTLEITERGFKVTTARP